MKQINELFIFLRIVTRSSRSSLEQALHLGESREVMRAQHAKGDASTFARHTSESLLAGYSRSCLMVLAAALIN